MATVNTLCRKLLNLNTATFSNFRTETSPRGVTSVYVEARVNKRHARMCPVCGRRWSVYDQGFGKSRRWRALGLSGLPFHIEINQERIECKNHGVQYPAVPWAYENSRFTKDFDKTVAWLSCHLSRKAISE